ncbi:hypothetical protein FOZ62_007992, partial [Perkinsus olseni]
AYWHGLESGLYIFFMSMFVESTYLNEFPRLPSPFGYIQVTFLLSYYGVAFMFKSNLSKAFAIWSNMGYIGHWYTLIRLLLWLVVKVWMCPRQSGRMSGHRGLIQNNGEYVTE